MKKIFLYASICLILSTVPALADNQPPIKIGEINSYKALPLYTENYRKGWQLAVEEINASGGIKGRKIEVVDRDDQGQPGEAIRVAQELLLSEKIDFLSGCMFGNVCIALADFATKNKIPTMRWFSNSEDETKRESNYAFGLNALYVTARAPAIYTLEKYPQLTHWASIAPNYAYGHQATKIFSDYLKQTKPSSTWSDTYWFPVGKLDAASTIGAIQQQQVDAVMNASFGSDVTQLIRMNARRQFDKDKTIVSLETAMPEYLDTIGAECPEGWIMTGYPRDAIDLPAHIEFVKKYEAKFGEKPGWMSLNGYNAYQFIFAALKKSPTLNPSDIVAAMEGLTVDTPIGTIQMRKSDHVSTQGIWVGRSHVVNKKAELVDWKYYPGNQVLVDESKVTSK